MPTVPVQTAPNVAPRGLGTTRQSAADAGPDAFGANIARATQQLGAQVAQAGNTAASAGLKIQAENNEREAKLKEVEFSQRLRAIGYGGEDGTAGFYSSQGEETIRLAPSVQQRIEEARQDILKTIENDRVKQMFGQSSQARATREQRIIDNHTISQTKVANDTASEARLNEAVDDGVAAGNDPAIIQRSLAIINSETVDMGERNGWNPEVVQSRIEAGQTLLFQTMITAAIKRQDTVMANDLFSTYGDQMDPPIRAEMEAKLATSNNLATSQAAVDEITSTAPVDEWAKLAREISDPALRKSVEEEIQRRIVQDERLRDINFNRSLSDATATIYDGGDLFAWGQQNIDEFSNLLSRPGTIESLQRAQDLVAKGELFRRTTDGSTFEQLRTMEADQFVQEDLQAQRHNLTEAEFGKLVTRQAAVQERLDQESKDFPTHNGAIRILGRAARRLDIDWGLEGQSPEERKTQAALEHDMTEFVKSFTDRDQTPTIAELEAEAARLTTPVTVPTGFTSTLEAIFGTGFGVGDSTLPSELEQLTPEQKNQLRVDLDDILPAQLEEARGVFKAHSVEATDDRLEQFFGAEVVGDGARQLRILQGQEEVEDETQRSGQSVTIQIPPAQQQRAVETPETNPVLNLLANTAPAEGNAIPAAAVAPEGNDDAESQDVGLTPVSEELANAVTTTSSEGARFLSTHEGGIRLQVYKDVAGNDTVGIGHLVKPGEDFSKGITREKALELFREDTAVAERAIDTNVKVDLSQNQHDALVSFIFNVGAGAFRNSTLLEKLNDQDFEGAAKELERWIRADGKVSQGLKNRRKAEKELFLKGAE